MTSSRGQRRAAAESGRAARFPSLAVALVLFAAAAVYWNSLAGPFVWDDQTAIVTNQTIRDLWRAWSPPRETPLAGRPVVNVSFALNYAAGGLNVTGYHLVNIAVHAGCALLLFGIVRRTLEGQATRLRLDTRSASLPVDALALIATLLWMLHPIQSEVVDYLTQRTESMMALFFFLTLYCAIRARRAPRHRARWEAAAVAACFLGVASKETMATAPLVLLLYDTIFEFDSWHAALRSRRRLYTGLSASWLLLGLLVWHAARSTVGVTAAIGPWTYFLNQLPLIARYLGLIVWPRALVFDYGLPRTLAFAAVAPAAILIALLAAATVVSFIRWPKIGFLLVTFCLTLAPSSSVVPVLTEVGAERRLYVPSAALAVLAVVGGWQLLRRLVAHYPNRSRAFVGGAIGLLITMLAALAVRTTYRNDEYASPLTLWRTVVDRYPHGRARASLATELVAAGRENDAISELRLAVPDFPDARYALGTELFASGHVEEAATELQAFIRPQPSRADRRPARLLLGYVLIARGQLDDAAVQFQSLLSTDASGKDAQEGMTAVGIAHRDLAAVFMRQNDMKQAGVHARAAVRLLPQDPAARNLLGVALASTGDLDEAVAQFRLALEISPNDTQVRNNLAHALSLPAATHRVP